MASDDSRIYTEPSPFKRFFSFVDSPDKEKGIAMPAL